MHNTKKIPHFVLDMEDNYLRNFYSNHIFKHGGNSYPYFDYDENNRRLDRIKAYASVRKDRHERQLTEMKSNTKARRDAGNKAKTDMSVCRVRF